MHPERIETRLCSFPTRQQHLRGYLGVAVNSGLECSLVQCTPPGLVSHKTKNKKIKEKCIKKSKSLALAQRVRQVKSSQFSSSACQLVRASSPRHTHTLLWFSLCGCSVRHSLWHNSVAACCPISQESSNQNLITPGTRVGRPGSV